MYVKKDLLSERIGERIEYSILHEEVVGIVSIHLCLLCVEVQESPQDLELFRGRYNDSYTKT